MPTPFAEARVMWLFAGLVMIAGCTACSGKPHRTVPTPVFSERDTVEAIRDGALALADCHREHVLAKLERRPADLTRARERLALALERLAPARIDPSKPRHERAAAALESALAGLDRVLASRKVEDEEQETVGWGQFERAIEALMLALAR